MTREVYDWFSKECEICNKIYHRPKGYQNITDKQWEARRFCGRKCQATYASSLVKENNGGNKDPFPFPQKGNLNYNAKLTEENVRAIRLDKRKHQEIADDYKISYDYVSKIKRKIKWPHLT